MTLKNLNKTNGYLDDYHAQLVPAPLISCTCGELINAFELSVLIDNDYISCNKCSKKLFIEDTVLILTHKVKNLMRDTELVKEDYWYHATSMYNADWLERVINNQVNVHVGEELAAHERALTLYSHASFDKPEPYLLFTLKLKTEASVSKTINTDTNDDDDLGNSDLEVYLNHWESPGSVSIYANPKMLEIVDIRMVTIEEASSLLSPYNIYA